SIIQKLPIPQPHQAKPIKELLKNKLTKKEFLYLFSSYDIVGSIAIIDIPKGLGKKKKLIANELLNSSKILKTVAIKSGATQGKYRIRKITPIAGIKTTKTISSESGCKFKIDINKAYYTNRFASDRLEIASQLTQNENVLALFSGICPYPIVIEKNAKNLPKKIIAIELNPQAHKLAIENISINKCSKIEAIHADAKKELKKKKYKDWENRILMPHPTQAMHFLGDAINAAKSGAIIHFYTFAPPENPKAPYSGAIVQAKAQNASLKLLHAKIVRPFSKEKSQVRLDLKVIKG
ncbi:MAG: hypothetical protein V1822_02980, partial [Candidatus Micrarchaeota archaeon]